MRFRHETRYASEFVVSIDTTDTTNSLAHLVSCWKIMWCPHRHHVVCMLTACCFHVDTTWFTRCTLHGFSHMDTMWFLCGHHMNSMWLIFHHFYVISVANRSQNIANLWKPVTSRFSIQSAKSFGKLVVSSIRRLLVKSDEICMKRICERVCGVYRHHRHHKLSRTSRFMLISRYLL